VQSSKRKDAMNVFEDNDLQLAYFTYEPEQDRLEFRSCAVPGLGAVDPCPSEVPELRLGSGLDMGTIRHAAKNAQPIHVHDCSQDGRWPADSEIRSLSILPVSSVGPCDVLVVASTAVDGISKRERSLARALIRNFAQPGESLAQCRVRLGRLERGLRRIRLEIAQMGIDGDQAEGAYPHGMAERMRLLSPREWQVMERLRSGLRVVTIARELTISPNTVRNHLKSIYRKLGVRSQVELLERMRGSEAAAAPLV